MVAQRTWSSRRGAPRGVSAANQITRRNRGASAEHVIDELRKFANGWMNYFGISHTYREVMMLDAWMRRRVRLYYWTADAAIAALLDAKPFCRSSKREDKQWKRPRTRRRNLLKLGADPKKVHMATRSRKGLWRISTCSIVCKALTDRWLKKQGVPEMRLPRPQ